MLWADGRLAQGCCCWSCTCATSGASAGRTVATVVCKALPLQLNVTNITDLLKSLPLQGAPGSKKGGRGRGRPPTAAPSAPPGLSRGGPGVHRETFTVAGSGGTYEGSTARHGAQGSGPPPGLGRPGSGTGSGSGGIGSGPGHGRPSAGAGGGGGSSGGPAVSEAQLKMIMKDVRRRLCSEKRHVSVDVLSKEVRSTARGAGGGGTAVWGTARRRCAGRVTFAAPGQACKGQRDGDLPESKKCQRVVSWKRGGSQ